MHHAVDSIHHQRLIKTFDKADCHHNNHNNNNNNNNNNNKCHLLRVICQSQSSEQIANAANSTIAVHGTYSAVPFNLLSKCL